ncbi:hypothetical protein OK016_23500 [Vibrio chagasii]|nr:hypothetical protein [Vibrio chagasii]
MLVQTSTLSVCLVTVTQITSLFVQTCTNSKSCSSGWTLSFLQQWIEKEGAYGNAERRTQAWYQQVKR